MLTTLSITISEMNLTERSKKCQIPKCERFVLIFHPILMVKNSFKKLLVKKDEQ
jgi:hypothetical protein